ncbi:hypothetical protein VHEMI02526 [[Torrubiella] hemipterigena]|uniref:Uncharacterized protein n=1 Tax=[Torrubiella] hemipterigena TaxID=1531966 RepID=A0A0A1TAR6_9HYPO|nr:hypothetical protein VHEMI02526 [[Torrubiella] hemipterigena]
MATNMNPAPAYTATALPGQATAPQRIAMVDLEANRTVNTTVNATTVNTTSAVQCRYRPWYARRSLAIIFMLCITIPVCIYLFMRRYH